MSVNNIGAISETRIALEANVKAKDKISKESLIQSLDFVISAENPHNEKYDKAFETIQEFAKKLHGEIQKRSITLTDVLKVIQICTIFENINIHAGTDGEINDVLLSFQLTSSPNISILTSNTELALPKITKVQFSTQEDTNSHIDPEKHLMNYIKSCFLTEDIPPSFLDEFSKKYFFYIKNTYPDWFKQLWEFKQEVNNEWRVLMILDISHIVDIFDKVLVSMEKEGKIDAKLEWKILELQYYIPSEKDPEEISRIRKVKAKILSKKERKEKPTWVQDDFMKDIEAKNWDNLLKNKKMFEYLKWLCERLFKWNENLLKILSKDPKKIIKNIIVSLHFFANIESTFWKNLQTSESSAKWPYQILTGVHNWDYVSIFNNGMYDEVRLSTYQLYLKNMDSLQLFWYADWIQDIIKKSNDPFFDTRMIPSELWSIILIWNLFLEAQKNPRISAKIKRVLIHWSLSDLKELYYIWHHKYTWKRTDKIFKTVHDNVERKAITYPTILEKVDWDEIDLKKEAILHTQIITDRLRDSKKIRKNHVKTVTFQGIFMLLWIPIDPSLKQPSWYFWEKTRWALKAFQEKYLPKEKIPDYKDPKIGIEKLLTSETISKIQELLQVKMLELYKNGKEETLRDFLLI